MMRTTTLKRSISALISVLLLALALSSPLSLLSQPAAALNGASQDARVQVGAPAPDFTLKNLRGKPVSLSELRGKPVVLYFWASWCPWCMRMKPALVRAHRTLNEGEGRNVAFVGIGISDTTRRLREAARKHAVPYTLLHDPKHKVADAYRVQGVPSIFFIDSDGIVQDMWPGALDEEEILRLARQLR